MRVASAWRTWPRPRDFSPPQLLGLVESLALAAIALLGLGLLWAILAPTGHPDQARPLRSVADASPAAFEGFDPFFHLNGTAGQSALVTGLDLKLFGIRADRVTGRGSAIIGLPDGTQNSYAVGEAIMPGAVLAAVAFDSVTINRNGIAEKLYLDQSDETPVVHVDPRPSAETPTPPANTPALMSEIMLSPRMKGAQVDGYVLQPAGAGIAFRAAGLRPGDVLVGVNGTPLSSADGTRQFAIAMQNGAPATVTVEREGKPISLTVAAK